MECRLIFSCNSVIGLEFVGEVIADFLGITNSRYQHVVDAYERELHRQKVQEEEEMELEYRTVSAGLAQETEALQLAEAGKAR